MSMFRFDARDNHSEYCDEHNQYCPLCNKELMCVECYIGAGSHYWILWCNQDHKRFTFDTYRFELEECK